MLTGMDEHGREVARRRERVPERRHLHEIGPRGRDQMDGLDGQGTAPKLGRTPKARLVKGASTPRRRRAAH